MTHTPKSLIAKLIILVVAVVLSPLIIAGVVAYVVYSAILYLSIWMTWCHTGSRVFVSYSRSPHWQARFEAVLIPRLPASTIIVNWSDRKTWSRLSLRTLAFEHFLGRNAHTPAVIIFRPLRRAQVFRFYEAYMKFKHGDELPVQDQESALLRALGVENPSTPTPASGSAFNR